MFLKKNILITWFVWKSLSPAAAYLVPAVEQL